MAKTYLFHGPSGSGKDTQVEMIQKEFQVERIATGEMFRKMYELGDPDAIEAHKQWGGGNFVQDDLTYKMFSKWMDRFDVNKTWIFLSVVRSVGQISRFDDLLAQYSRDLDGFVHFKLSREAAIERLSLRTICPNCQATFHSKYKKEKVSGICDYCGTKLVQREDDKEEKIISRLDEYNKSIEPILNTYEERGLLIEIDASRTIEEIFENVKESIEL